MGLRVGDVQKQAYVSGHQRPNYFTRARAAGFDWRKGGSSCQSEMALTTNGRARGIRHPYVPSLQFGQLQTRPVYFEKGEGR
jgi:hypothetical protein